MGIAAAGLALGAAAVSFVLRRAPHRLRHRDPVPRRPAGYVPRHRRQGRADPVPVPVAVVAEPVPETATD